MKATVRFIYFNIDSRGAGQPDWRLTKPTEALEEYTKLLDRAKFQGQIP